MDAVTNSEISRYSEKATAVAHAWLREPLYRELEIQSAGRREHVDVVTGKIVTAAILLGIVDDLVAKAEELLQIR